MWLRRRRTILLVSGPDLGEGDRLRGRRPPDIQRRDGVLTETWVRSGVRASCPQVRSVSTGGFGQAAEDRFVSVSKAVRGEDRYGRGRAGGEDLGLVVLEGSQAWVRGQSRQESSRGAGVGGTGAPASVKTSFMCSRDITALGNPEKAAASVTISVISAGAKPEDRPVRV